MSEAAQAREDPTAGGQGPVIIKRVKKGGHGHHGGAWKVAYADMVTALMALFIVLWILSQSDEVVRNVAGYFKDPVGFVEGGYASPMDGGAPGSAVVAIAEETAGDGGDDRGQRWRDAASEIRTRLASVPGFAKYADQIELSITAEGLRVSLVESADTPLFEVGGTELHADARQLLEAISQELVRLPNSILVEGHTDSRGFAAGANMTNWELSTGRAHTARRVMEAAGIPAARMLEVRGFADRRLYNPADPDDSRNRRVAITLLSDEAASRLLDEGEEEVLP